MCEKRMHKSGDEIQLLTLSFFAESSSTGGESQQAEDGLAIAGSEDANQQPSIDPVHTSDQQDGVPLTEECVVPLASTGGLGLYWACLAGRVSSDELQGHAMLYSQITTRGNQSLRLGVGGSTPYVNWQRLA